MRTNFSIALFSLMLVAFFAGPTEIFAHGGATGIVNGIVKERMEVMKSIGKMARGKAPLDNKKIARAAGKIADHSTRITTLFPKGSDQGVSEASPKI